MADKSALSGLIMEGTRFEGKIFFEKTMRIDGEFMGEMESKDQLIVGKTAKVNADIKVREVIIMGEVRGTISACETLQILETGRVIADIGVKNLDIRPGAVFEGNCNMNSGSKPGKVQAASK